MAVRILIAGESQCEMFADACIIADHLSQNLPEFCWDRIEKPVLEWEAWLSKTNQKNKWHHTSSPLIWKEMLMKGSKPYYIGGISEFLEYCHSYYKFDCFLSPEKFDGLSQNIGQFQMKMKNENVTLKELQAKFAYLDESPQKSFVVCITGAGNVLTMHLISGLLEMSVGEKSISRIYLFDDNCTGEFMEYVERECSYIATDYPTKVVKYVGKIGAALTHTDLLIVLDHAPFNENLAIGDWLKANRRIMVQLALMINASATRKIYILFPNLGPACYNATILSRLVNINKKNIVVATADLGLGISCVAAEIAEVPQRNMFCPPVWGFVGINHLVDIRTTVHKYNTFEPYNRYIKIRNSSLLIGTLTPELRTMEYLMYFDDSLWKKVLELRKKRPKGQSELNKVIPVLDVVRHWLFDRNPSNIVNLGVECNGSFGLNFKGIFSQPSRFVNGEWVPASDYMLPKDANMKLNYLENIANLCMEMKKGDLPKIIPFYPCTCKPRFHKKKGVWF